MDGSILINPYESGSFHEIFDTNGLIRRNFIFSPEEGFLMNA